MKHGRRAAGAALVAGMFVAGALRAQHADSLSARVDSIFAPWNRTDSPGCLLGISRHGVILYEKGYGMANLEDGIAITPASIFHVASISKQFTAMAILLLAQRGRLSLDDDVRRYIPELPDYGKTVTIRHLLTHTSGLRDQWDLLSLAGWREDDLITEDDVLRIVTRQRGLNFPPGTEYLYSNTGFTLAAIIVRRVSGQSLRVFADSNIFIPLGLAHTHFHDDHTMIVPNRTSAYQPRDSGGWRVSIPVFDTYGATSLFTTAEDLLRWEQNFSDARVGGRDLLAQMQTRAVLTTGDTTSYGLGLAVDRFRGLRTVGHSGADAGYRADVVRFPDQDFAVTALCNRSDVNPGILARRVAEIYLARDFLAPAAAAPPSPPAASAGREGRLSAERLAAMAGLYRNPMNDDVRRLVVREGQLVYERGGTAIPLVPVDSDRFAIAGAPVTVAFVSARSGRPQELHVLQEGQRPIIYQWMEPYSPTYSQLGAFAGAYTSDELGVGYGIAVHDSGLVVQGLKGPDAVLRPLFAEAFSSDDFGLVKFTRDGRGRVVGFTVNTGRVRGVRFVRGKSR